MTDAALADLVGRILFTHRIDPRLVTAAPGIDAAAADDLIACGQLSVAVDRTRLELFASIMVRLEIRCRHDSKAIRAALDIPLSVLGNRAPIEVVASDVHALRQVRSAIDHVHGPTIRMWRIGH